MAIILDLSKEEYDAILRDAGSMEDLDARLERMQPLSVYRYEEVVNADELKTQLETAERERDEIKQKYIDRFFGGTGIEIDNRAHVRDIVEEERRETSVEDSLNPEKFDDLLVD